LNLPAFDSLGPFDTVLDVGGNVGAFAQAAVEAWPDAQVSSFEPIAEIAALNLERAAGRWQVFTVALSNMPAAAAGVRLLNVCENQPSASTLQPPGSARRKLGIVDRFKQRSVPLASLDDFLELARGRVLVKVDVEGHEGHVLAGASRMLRVADTVLVEVQNDPGVFIGAPAPCEVDEALRRCGLRFWGVADVFCAPGGRVLQFDGVWRREDARPKREHGVLGGSQNRP
jgi:FkbM family methyltransferase